MNVLCEMRHGSHLYGLNTKNSDVDYKGVFLPSFEDMVTGNASHEIRESTGAAHEKNTKDDIDNVHYSLQKFIKMACDGETIAIDMLHCNDTNLRHSTPIWEAIVANRSMFYTKNMKAFLGYCRKQAAKYGVKGTRLAAMEELLDYLKVKLAEDPGLKMNADSGIKKAIRNISARHPSYIKIMDGFYKGEKYVERKVVEVCDAKYDFTTRVEYVVDAIQKKYDAYGHRAQAAKNNEGVDWKAISHALRAAYQLKEIYQTGDLQYPLKDRKFLLEVKMGKLDFTTVVQPELERVISEVEQLAEASNLPKKVDRKFWDQFIVDVYKGKYDSE